MAAKTHVTPTVSTHFHLRKLSKICAWAIIFIACMVLLGWQFNNTILKSLRSDTVPMNPVTAIGFLITGTALLLKQEKTSPLSKKRGNYLAFSLMFIGGLKLISILTGINIPFDEILFNSRLYVSVIQDNIEIAPNTALNFLLTGTALVFIDYETSKKRRPAQYLSIIITLFSLLSLYGYLYGISALYSVKTFIPMAIYTGFCFLLTGASILFARPDKGSMSLVIGENSGQIIFMRFIAFLLPLVYGWLKIYGENAGWFSKEFGTALFAILAYAVSMTFLARQSVLQHKVRETRRIAMEAIKENERRLQAILDNSATNISLKSLLGRYTLINKQFEKDFNATPETALGKTDYDLFPKELARELNQYDHQIIKSGQPKSFEEKYPQKDGLHTYITVKFPLFDQNQRIYAIGAVSTDITKRKHLENELRKSHQRLFGILDNIGEGVMVADKSGNFIIFNKRAEEILGNGMLDATIETWSEKYGIYTPGTDNYFPTADLPLKKALEGIDSDNVEMVIRTEKFPEGRWIAVTGRPVYDAEEIIAGTIVFRDITLRKRLEGLFSENEKRLKMILSSIGEGVIIIDKQEEVILFNPKATEILGSGPPNIPLEAWPAHFGWYKPNGNSLYTLEELPMAEALKGNSPAAAEVDVKNNVIPEGRHLLITAEPVKGSLGTITGMLIDMRDITEQRKLEEHLQEIQDQFRNLLRQQRP